MGQKSSLLPTLLFWTLISSLPTSTLTSTCRPLHAQAHGVNLVCCSANDSLTESCEFSSLCGDVCSCFATFTRDLDCQSDVTGVLHDYEWKDHRPNSEPLPCARPNWPNPLAPYTLLIEDADPRSTSLLVNGSCGAKVTSLTTQSWDAAFDDWDLATCFPELAAFQVVLLKRKNANFAGLRQARALTTMSVVNANFEFWPQMSSIAHTLTFLHLENSSVSDLPKWLALGKSLTRLFIKNTRLQSLATVAQMPATRSLKLSHNAFENLQRHVFVSTSLVQVDLSHNRITSLASHTFSKCVDLRILDLSDNPIVMLPYKPFVRNTRLKWLKLSGTRITSLSPEHFAGLNSLKTLTLSNNALHAVSPYAFVPLKSLRSLDLDGCNLTRIPQAVVFNCHLTRLNVADNRFQRNSALPPEVLAMLSGLAQLRIDGNPLQEFPPSLLLISAENVRLLRQLLHTSMMLPVWQREPCTPYYWALRLRNKSTTLKSFLSQYSDERMRSSGLSYCKEQFEWMSEQMDVYRELEKNSGCAAQRRLRSSLGSSSGSLDSSIAATPSSNCSTSNSANADDDVDDFGQKQHRFELAPVSTLFVTSLVLNFFLFAALFICTCISCFSTSK